MNRINLNIRGNLTLKSDLILVVIINDV